MRKFMTFLLVASLVSFIGYRYYLEYKRSDGFKHDPSLVYISNESDMRTQVNIAHNASVGLKNYLDSVYGSGNYEYVGKATAEVYNDSICILSYRMMSQNDVGVRRTREYCYVFYSKLRHDPHITYDVNIETEKDSVLMGRLLFKLVYSESNGDRDRKIINFARKEKEKRNSFKFKRRLEKAQGVRFNKSYKEIEARINAADAF